MPHTATCTRKLAPCDLATCKCAESQCSAFNATMTTTLSLRADHRRLQNVWSDCDDLSGSVSDAVAAVLSLTQRKVHSSTHRIGRISREHKRFTSSHCATTVQWPSHWRLSVGSAHRRYRVVPVQERRKLVLYWPTPPTYAGALSVSEAP